MPGFIAKAGVKQIPSVGMIATAIGSVYLDRRNKDDRHKVMDVIKNK